jgi:hypothetical protein
MNTPAAVDARESPVSIGGPIGRLDDIWLLTLLAVVIAAAMPYLLGAFAIDVNAAIWGVIGLGAVHVALTAAAERGWSSRTLMVIQALGVIQIGLVWQHAGAVQNPLFLLTFALPVIGAGLISRRQPYIMAVLAILGATIVALGQAPELLWYVGGINRTGAWLAALLGGAQSSAPAPLYGFYAPAGYFVVMLAVFATLLGACAASAEFLALLVTGLHTQAAVAHRETDLAQERWMQLIQGLPVPALLVDVETLQVVHRSAGWVSAFCRVDAPPAGDLSEMLRFSYPEVVEELIAGDGGSVRPCMFRLAGQLRVGEVHVQPLLHLDRRLALVILTDVTEAFCLQTALDASHYAAVLVDSETRVVGYNKPARGLFADIETGIDARPLLGRADTRHGAWDPGLRGRRKSRVRMNGRCYEVYISAVAVPGEEQPLRIIAFVPAANTSARDAFLPAAACDAT